MEIKHPPAANLAIASLHYLCYNVANEFTFDRYDGFITQLPFELKLSMLPTDRGGRGYSDELVLAAQKESQEVIDELELVD